MVDDTIIEALDYNALVTDVHLPDNESVGRSGKYIQFRRYIKNY